MRNARRFECNSCNHVIDPASGTGVRPGNTAKAASWRASLTLRAVFVFSILMTDSRFEQKTSGAFRISFH